MYSALAKSASGIISPQLPVGPAAPVTLHKRRRAKHYVHAARRLQDWSESWACRMAAPCRGGMQAASRPGAGESCKSLLWFASHATCVKTSQRSSLLQKYCPALGSPFAAGFFGRTPRIAVADASSTMMVGIRLSGAMTNFVSEGDLRDAQPPMSGRFWQNIHRQHR